MVMPITVITMPLTSIMADQMSHVAALSCTLSQDTESGEMFQVRQGGRTGLCISAVVG